MRGKSKTTKQQTIELKQVEKELKKSQVFLDRIIEQSPYAMWISDDKGTLIKINKACCDLLNITEEEVIGKYNVLKDNIVEEQGFLPLVKSVYEKGETARFELKYDTSQIKKLSLKKTAFVILDVTIFPIIDTYGKITNAVIQHMDITRRKQAEETLQASEANCRNLADSITDIFFAMDEDLRYTYWNKASEKLTGISAEDALGKHIYDLFPDNEAAKKVAEVYLTVLKTKQPKSFINEFRLNGENFVFEVNAYPTGKGLSVFVKDITERKRLGEYLEKERQEIKLIIDSSPIIIFYKDKEGRFVRVNRAFAEALKMPEEKFVGKTVFDFYSAEIAQGMTDDDQEVFKTGRPKLNIIEQYKSASGMRWVQTDKVPIFDQNGIVIGLIGFAQDITEQKQAEKLLRESEERYRGHFENASDVIYSYDLEFRITSISPSVKRILGYDPAELEGRPFPDLNILSPDSLGVAVSDAMRLLKGEQVAFAVYQFIARDGTGKFGEVSGTPVFRDGKVVGVTCVARDITDRRQAEKSLKESEERYRTLFETAADGILIADTETKRHKYANPAICKMLGYTEAELMKLGVADVHPKDSLEQIISEFNVAVKEGKLPLAYNIPCLRKDGTIIYTDVKTSATLIDGSKCIVGFFTDVTRRRQAEEERKRNLEKLQKTVEGAIETIAAMAETRDPYTAGHQRRVSKLASAIAQEMGLPKEQIEKVRVAGILHDIGKVSVPSEILSKPTKLNQIEIDLIRGHPKVSRDILKTMELPWPICPIVLQHHERMDGSGYTEGLSGQDILLEARILAVADVVEAMASHRPYRPAHGVDKALEEITQNKGTLYDAEVVAVCVKLFTEKGFKFEQD